MLEGYRKTQKTAGIRGCFIDFPYRNRYSLLGPLIDTFFYFFGSTRHYHPEGRNLILQAKLRNHYHFQPVDPTLQPNAWIAPTLRPDSYGYVYAVSPSLRNDIERSSSSMGMRFTFLDRETFNLIQPVRTFTPLNVGHTLVKNQM